jgi:type I restriction enzyme S subunit
MGSNYKRLGDFINKVERRNRDSKVINLRGISMTKQFRETTSNIVGTDMSVYKVMTKWQFACDFMSVIRVHKFPVVLKTDDEPNLVSPAYPVFEVKNPKELDPEYLMMWFRRSEFDRYADFKCDSAIRGGFDWDALCDCMLPIPSLEKQLEIVKEYNVIQNRITLNNQLITKLEETAQALYKQWFVDFEFPDANGKSYRSNGGEMVFCEELDREIPVGWNVADLDKVTKQVCVGFVGTCYDYYCDSEVGVPMLRTTDLNESGMSYKNLKYVTEEFHLKNKKSHLKKGDILVARHGTNGLPVIFNSEHETNCLNVIIIKPNINIASSKLIHCFLKSDIVKSQVESSVGGSVQAVLNTGIISKLRFLCNDKINMEISLKLEIIETNIEHYRKTNFIIEELNDLILARMTKVESEKVNL